MSLSILVFSRSTPHHRVGGMEVQSWQLAAEWAKRGNMVRFVTSAIPGFSTPFTEDGVIVSPLNGTKPGRYSSSWWERSRDYWDALEDGPDVVFSVSAGAYSVARNRSRHPRTRFVMQAHGTSVMELQSKLASRSLRSLATTPKQAFALGRDLIHYRHFDRIVAVGERVASSLTARPLRSSSAERVLLIQNGARSTDYGFDPIKRDEIRAALGIQPGITVVACIGRLHVQKRLDRTLRAAAVLRDSGLSDQYRFLLIGNGPDERRLRELADRLRLGRTVEFIGPVNRDQIRAWYSAADISLLTTAWLEGLPMAVLEALACGLPCIVTTGSVAAKALDHVVCQVDTANPEVLANALTAVPRGRSGQACLLPPDFLLENGAARYLRDFEALLATVNV